MKPSYQSLSLTTIKNDPSNIFKPKPGSFVRILVEDAEISSTGFKPTVGATRPCKIVTARVVGGSIVNGIADGSAQMATLFIEHPVVYFLASKKSYYESMHTQSIHDTSRIISDFWEPSKEEWEGFYATRGEIDHSKLGEGRHFAYGANVEEQREMAIRTIEALNAPAPLLPLQEEQQVDSEQYSIKL